MVFVSYMLDGQRTVKSTDSRGYTRIRLTVDRQAYYVDCKACLGRGYYINRETREAENCTYCEGKGWHDEREREIDIIKKLQKAKDNNNIEDIEFYELTLKSIKIQKANGLIIYPDVTEEDLR